MVERSARPVSEKTLRLMHSNVYRRLRFDQPSCTITHVRKAVTIHPSQDRLLSVREAARLQSFPDWFRFSGSLDQQYQQVADAVPPILATAIAKRLGEFMTTEVIDHDQVKPQVPRRESGRLIEVSLLLGSKVGPR